MTRSGIRPPPPSASPGWSVVVETEPEALSTHVPAWNGLAEAAVEANIFHEPWMFLPALAAFGAGLTFLFVFVYGPNPANPLGPSRLCGFFPLVWKRRYKGLPASVLRLWSHDYGLLATPLIRNGTLQPCLDEFLRWLKADSNRPAIVEFDSIAADGPFYHAFMNALRQHHLPFQVDDCFVRPLFRRRENGEAFLSSALSTVQRRQLRRKARRLAEIGNLIYRDLEPDSDLDALLPAYLEIEASGWKGRAGTAIILNHTEKIYFETVVREAHRRRRLGIIAQELDGRPIAFQSYFTSETASFSFKSGYREEYSRYSPGILLQVELIERLHHHPQVQWMDSCSGPDAYLQQVWPDQRMIQSVHVATGRSPGELVLASLPLLRWAKRRLWGPSSPLAERQEAPSEFADSNGKR